MLQVMMSSPQLSYTLVAGVVRSHRSDFLSFERTRVARSPSLTTLSSSATLSLSSKGTRACCHSTASHALARAQPPAAARARSARYQATHLVMGTARAVMGTARAVMGTAPCEQYAQQLSGSVAPHPTVRARASTSRDGPCRRRRLRPARLTRRPPHLRRRRPPCCC